MAIQFVTHTRFKTMFCFRHRGVIFFEQKLYSKYNATPIRVKTQKTQAKKVLVFEGLHQFLKVVFSI